MKAGNRQQAFRSQFPAFRLLPVTRWLLPFLSPVACCLLPVAFLYADDEVTIEPREKWSNIFANQQVDLHFTVRSRQAVQGPARWAFSVNQRVLARGETKVEGDSGALIRLSVPEVKPGVVVRALLTVSIHSTTHEKVLWIFPPDPFTDRLQWLKSLKITLFDPERTTAGVLKKTGVPFTETRNLAALAERNDGLVLVGEGVSFKNQRGLAETLVKIARRGVPVLCLAPADGDLVFSNATMSAPKGIVLRRADIITELDKRLDAEAWPGGSSVASGLTLKTVDGNLVAETQKGAEGWPWVEIDFPGKKAKLLICGFGMMKQWEAGPTPRYLFARMLERMGEIRDER